MLMNKEMFLKALELLSDRIIDSKELLNDLDTQIGDSDHGSNMTRGFTEAKKKIDMVKDKDFSTILKTIAMTLISTVGGASGPLYGTAFLKASMSVKDREVLVGEDFIKIHENVISGIKQRGHAERGHKTMLDAIIPAYEAFKESIEAGEDLKIASQKATDAAKEGMEYTKGIKAIKGRASFLGDRSIGHVDPGATSSFIIINAINDVIKEG
ncbi:dihydroxyacetone kinase subunit L [Anaeromicrobium sediminis]|uniref:phosphoenolpyruvate--glycerone phosphotransferase n=1 Tax=Anaeromicrobium sediminis TaxID=1478221 RepID=A0A267MN46_9FIRM|nr:dihydroxyacetone kinase subunit L [Anaeromicrobium sediminis]